MFDIDKIAALSKLYIEEEKRDLLKTQMEQLIRFAGRLADMELQEPASNEESVTGKDGMRSDFGIYSCSAQQVLANAPEQKDGFFFVPQVVKEE